MSDIVERLRKKHPDDGTAGSFLYNDAADTIERLRAENAALTIQTKKMREALESCAAGDYSTSHVIHPSFDETLVNAALADCDEVLNRGSENDAL